MRKKVNNLDRKGNMMPNLGDFRVAECIDFLPGVFMPETKNSIIVDSLDELDSAKGWLAVGCAFVSIKLKRLCPPCGHSLFASSVFKKQTGRQSRLPGDAQK